MSHWFKYPQTIKRGYDLQCMEQIDNNDIQKLLELLSTEFSSNEYSLSLYWEPTGSGIRFNFNDHTEWFKVIQLNTLWYNPELKLWVSENLFTKSGLLTLQTGIVDRLESGKNIYTLLLSYNGAPLWTKEELELFEKCFNKINIHVISEYPKKFDDKLW